MLGYSLSIKALQYNIIILSLALVPGKGPLPVDYKAVYIFIVHLFLFIFNMYHITLYKQLNLRDLCLYEIFFFLKQLKYGQNARCDAAKKTENTSKNRFKSIYACKLFALYQG